MKSENTPSNEISRLLNLSKHGVYKDRELAKMNKFNQKPRAATQAATCNKCRKIGRLLQKQIGSKICPLSKFKMILVPMSERTQYTEDKRLQEYCFKENVLQLVVEITS